MSFGSLRGLDDPDVEIREAEAAFLCSLEDLRFFFFLADVAAAPSGKYGIALFLSWIPS